MVFCRPQTLQGAEKPFRPRGITGLRDVMDGSSETRSKRRAEAYPLGTLRV